MLLEVNYKQRHSALGLSDLGCSMAQGSAEPPHAGMTSVQNVNVQTQASSLDELSSGSNHPYPEPKLPIPTSSSVELKKAPVLNNEQLHSAPEEQFVYLVFPVAV